MSPKMIPDKLNKVSAVIHLSDEELFTWSNNPEYWRKTKTTVAEPTPEAWQRYRRAQKAMKILRAYEGTEWGGPDYGTEVHPPLPTTTYEYLETHEEWLDRCRKLQAAGIPLGNKFEL